MTETQLAAAFAAGVLAAVLAVTVGLAWRYRDETRG